MSISCSPSIVWPLADTWMRNSGVTPDTADSDAEASKSTETLSQQPTTATVTPVQQKTAPSPASSRRQFWRLWRRPAAQRAAAAERVSTLAAYPPFPAGVEPIRLPESQAACCICLCGAYEFDPPIYTCR